MEEISAALGNILSDPAKLEQLRQAAQSLGLAPPLEGQATPAAGATGTETTQGQTGTPSGQTGEAAGGATGEPAPTLEEATPRSSTGAMDTLSKLSELLQSCSQPDKNEELLRTLRPHFSPQRASRIDDAIRIMQLCRLWPALRESGLLGDLGALLKGGNRG